MPPLYYRLLLQLCSRTTGRATMAGVGATQWVVPTGPAVSGFTGVERREIVPACTDRVWHRRTGGALVLDLVNSLFILSQSLINKKPRREHNRRPLVGRIGRGSSLEPTTYILGSAFAPAAHWSGRNPLHLSQFRRLLSPPFTRLGRRSIGATGFLFRKSRPVQGTGRDCVEPQHYFIRTIFLVAVNSLVFRR